MYLTGRRNLVAYNLQLLHGWETPVTVLNGTLTCISLSGTALFETYVARLGNLDVYSWGMGQQE